MSMWCVHRHHIDGLAPISPRFNLNIPHFPHFFLSWLTMTLLRLHSISMGRFSRYPAPGSDPDRIICIRVIRLFPDHSPVNHSIKIGSCFAYTWERDFSLREKGFSQRGKSTQFSVCLPVYLTTASTQRRRLREPFMLPVLAVRMPTNRLAKVYAGQACIP